MKDANEFPPRERLAHVVGSLLAFLSREYSTLLAAERFAEMRGALARLGDADILDAAVGATAPAEAAALADRLLERWACLGPIALYPVAAIIGPEAVWSGGEPVEAVYRVVAAAVEPDWSADWTGNVRELPDRRSAALMLPPDMIATGGIARIACRVIARGREGRCILVADRAVPVHRLGLRLDAPRRLLTFLDGADRAVAGIEVRVGGAVFRTGPDGTIESGTALPPGTAIEVPGTRFHCP